MPLGARTVNELPESVTSVEKTKVTAPGEVVTVESITGSALTKSNAKAGELESVKANAMRSGINALVFKAFGSMATPFALP